MSMMKSYILKSTDLSKTHECNYVKKVTFFLLETKQSLRDIVRGLLNAK